MTSAADPVAPTLTTGGYAVACAPLLWLTGLAGSGKSTLARALHQRLAEAGESAQLLDGDALRVALDSRDQQACHDRDSRLRRAWRIAHLAHDLAARGQPVIVATISLFHPVQEWNRLHHRNYAEVWLDATLDRLRAHRPELYGDQQRPPARWVWGVDLVPEYPRAPELRIQQDFAADSLHRHLQQLLAVWNRLRGGVAR